MKKVTISLRVTPELLEDLYVAQRVLTTSRAKEARRPFNELNRLIVTVAEVLRRHVVRDSALREHIEETGQPAAPLGPSPGAGS